MGRGRSSSGGSSRGSSSSSSRGGSRSSWSRGSSRSSWGSSRHTTVVIGGGGHSYHTGSAASTRIVPAVILFIFGTIITIFSFLMLVDRLSYGSTYGTCLDNDYLGGWYYTSYSYTVDDRDYVNRSEEGWEFPEVKGNTVKIYYKKSNPNIITEKEPAGIVGCVAAFLVATGLNAGGVALVIAHVKAKKKENDVAVSNTTSLSTEAHIEPESTHTVCSYCGGIYLKTAQKCPHCGASKH